MAGDATLGLPPAARQGVTDGMTHAVWPMRAAWALMGASGFAALGYQIVWTQQASLWLGHEAAAVLAVVAAFFAGLAVGAWGLGRAIERSAHPARWYAACEAVVALWSVALAALLAPVSGALLAAIGPQPSEYWQWGAAFGGTFLLLLPATAAMGATLPAMQRVLAAWRWRGGSLAALYAANTFGAVTGVLAAAFWLIPAFGLLRTAQVCAGLNLLCALAALRWFDRPAARPVAARPEAVAPGDRAVARRTLAVLAATGLLGIGYEVLVVRVLSQVAENTVYTFAMLLAVYLVGSALGAAAYQRWAVPHVAVGRQDRVQSRLLWAVALACLLGGASLWGVQAVRAVLAARLGGGVAAALAQEAALAAVAFLLPTVAMGALFSHLSARAFDAGMGWGRSLGVNTLGAAAAPLGVGVLLLPGVGAKWVLAGLVIGYIGLGLGLEGGWGSRRERAVAAAFIGLTSCVIAWAPPLAFIDVPEGGRVVSYREGAMAAVSVVEDAQGVARLRIDNRQQEGSTNSLLADGRQALLPLLLHPSPQRALFLGLGTGVTARAAAQDPSLQVDVVELLPEVIAASPYFTARVFDDDAAAAATPRLHVMAADARRYVRAASPQYDVIVSDNFHPARSGSGALYTVEHFQAVRERLAEQGLFCQWLPLHQLDLATLRSIVQSFIAVYPNGSALLATHSLDTPVLGLIGRQDDGRFDLAAVRGRLAAAPAALGLAAFGLSDDFTVLGSFIAGPRALDRFAGDAPLNTDDHPVVAYGAPRVTYAPDSLPRDRLVALLHDLSVEPSELLTTSSDAAQYAPRLAAYWAARDRFIDVGRGVQPTADVQRMLAQVREPLLAVLRQSPDFRPAYEPLVRMAGALSRTDPDAARALVAELSKIQPTRPRPFANR